MQKKLSFDKNVSRNATKSVTKIHISLILAFHFQTHTLSNTLLSLSPSLSLSRHAKVISDIVGICVMWGWKRFWEKERRLENKKEID